MKWKVSIGYRGFIFDTLQEASIFAQAAVDHMEPNAEFSIIIEYVNVEEVAS